METFSDSDKAFIQGVLRQYATQMEDAARRSFHNRGEDHDLTHSYRDLCARANDLSERI